MHTGMIGPRVTSPCSPPPVVAPEAEPTEIVTTAVQAAGELAQLGATIGGQLLRRAAGRIPRP